MHFVGGCKYSLLYVETHKDCFHHTLDLLNKNHFTTALHTLSYSWIWVEKEENN